jgi:hypothetical protein
MEMKAGQASSAEGSKNHPLPFEEVKLQNKLHSFPTLGIAFG